MTDEPEFGPDPNEIRRHAKKMMSEYEYRRTYRRIDFYRPNDRQREFHNTHATEVMFRAGNQMGKTHAAGAQFTMDGLAMWPEWYEGHRFLKPPKIERPHEWLGWSASTTSVKARDGAQLKLLGNIREERGMGQGLIPLDNIVGRPAMARGISDFVDTVNLIRETGGKAVIQFKTYEQKREAFQGSPVDEMWLDEDVSRDNGDIYGECLARLVTTNGRIICSLTPLLGLSPLRKRFKMRTGSSMAEVLMTIWDCAESKGGHIPDARIPDIIANYSENERETRAFGSDMQGEGAVFMTPVERIKHHRDPAEFPSHWPWIWGLDFSHGGLSESSHPFAAVLGCWDRDNDIVYIVAIVRMRKALAANHVEAMRPHPCFLAPCAWPHDGGTHTAAGITLAASYKKLGLNMMQSHAVFPDGGYSFEGGITLMEERFASGRLMVSSHLAEYFDEYLGYHREDGLVHKVDDDLMSATRVLLMGLRDAKTLDQVNRRFFSRSTAEPEIAEGADFDLFEAF